MASYIDQFSPLLDVVVDGTCQISVLRGDVHKKLVELGFLPQESDVQSVRLREKWNAKPGFLLRDGFTLQQSHIHLVEGRQIAVQVLLFVYILKVFVFNATFVLGFDRTKSVRRRS